MRRGSALESRAFGSIIEREAPSQGFTMPAQAAVNANADAHGNADASVSPSQQ